MSRTGYYPIQYGKTELIYVVVDISPIKVACNGFFCQDLELIPFLTASYALLTILGIAFRQGTFRLIFSIFNVFSHVVKSFHIIVGTYQDMF